MAVLLFPEGSSTDGSRYSPSVPLSTNLRSRPCARKCRCRHLPDGDDYVERDPCYYGDICFFPRLLQTLGVRGVRRLDFSPTSVIYDNLRAAVLKTRGEVIDLRAAQRQSTAAEFRDTPETSRGCGRLAGHAECIALSRRPR